MTIGDLIKEARKKANLTQKELGQRIGLSYQSIAQWENNLRKPKPETLQKIANALGVSIWSLSAAGSPLEFSYGFLSGLEEERSIRSAFNYTYSKKEQELIDLFFELNDDGQCKAIERIQELTEIPKYKKETAPEVDPEQQTEKAPDATNIQD